MLVESGEFRAKIGDILNRFENSINLYKARISIMQYGSVGIGFLI